MTSTARIDSSGQTALSSARSSDRGRLELLQLLRFIAATMVVLLHAQVVASVIADHHLPIQLGAGVDLFFVISGFVITYTARRYLTVPGGWSQFFSRRLLRILPLYWTVLSLRVILLAAAAAFGAKELPTVMAIITSYLFIPYDSAGLGPAYPFPVLDLGWTLNYEMFFYVTFTIFIFMMRGRAVWATAVFLGLGVAATSLWTPSLLPLDFWFRPIVLEFVCGMFIAVAYGNGYRISVWSALVLVAIGLCLWTLVDMTTFKSYGGPGFYSFPRFFIFGGGAICMVSAATLIPKWKAPLWLCRISGLGDSSYTLYLLHPFLLPIFRSALPRLHVSAVLYWPVVFTIVASAVFLAHLVYVRVETPAMQLLRKHLFSGNIVQPA